MCIYISIKIKIKKMKFTLILTLIIAIYTEPPSNYSLVWSDEFEGSTINSSKWVYDTGGDGWGNNEYEYYTDRNKNSYVSDGKLHIKAIKEKYKGKKYTSARMKTKGKLEFQYGYIEANISLPRGTGIWPAFWMLGSDIDEVSWPKCGEIDIIEAINTENKIHSTCHWYSNGHAQYSRSSETFDITQFHIYYLYWDKEYIRAGVDGK